MTGDSGQVIGEQVIGEQVSGESGLRRRFMLPAARVRGTTSQGYSTGYLPSGGGFLEGVAVGGRSVGLRLCVAFPATPLAWAVGGLLVV